MFIKELPSPLQAEITFINLYDKGFCSPLPMTNPSGHKVYCSVGTSSLVPGVLLKFFVSVRESEPRLVFAPSRLGFARRKFSRKNLWDQGTALFTKWFLFHGWWSLRGFNFFICQSKGSNLVHLQASIQVIFIVNPCLISIYKTQNVIGTKRTP